MKIIFANRIDKKEIKNNEALCNEQENTNTPLQTNTHTKTNKKTPHPQRIIISAKLRLQKGKEKIITI